MVSSIVLLLNIMGHDRVFISFKSSLEIHYVMLKKYNKYNIYFVSLCVTSNYPLNIIHSFNLGNTFYGLFRHI